MIFEAPFIAIRSFFEAGGNVLWAIFVVTMLMWTLIIERIWFFRTVLPGEIDKRKQEWEGRQDQRSWRAQRIRAMLISEMTGMIQVFNVMAVAGTSNARLMAGGVSAATIPTMAGLVAALSGYYFASWLQRRADDEIKKVSDLLVAH
jgi:biopolymer transport protein ExbB